MKRSEMIQIIKRLYKLEIDRYPKNAPADMFAENLLANLEEKGMVPPNTIVEFGGQIYQDNCWDKEDK